MSESIHIQKVSSHTLAAIDPRLGSNAAAVVLDDFIVLIDAGMRPYSARMLIENLEFQYQLPVKFACVTHYHHDHTFSLSALKDVTLFASAQTAKNLKQSPDWTPEAFSRWKNDDESGGQWLDEVEFIIPTVLFHNAIDIVNKDKIVEFHHSGGHTSCSTFGFFPDENVLFAGDLLFSDKFPFAGDVTCNPEKWIAVLKSWLKMEVKKVIPGHGPVADIKEVERQLEFFEELKENTLTAIKAGKNAREIVLPNFYSFDSNAKWFADRTQQRWYDYYKSKPAKG